MNFGLCNPKYYRETFLKIQKFMEVREEGMEVQEETVHLPKVEPSPQDLGEVLGLTWVE